MPRRAKHSSARRHATQPAPRTSNMQTAAFGIPRDAAFGIPRIRLPIRKRWWRQCSGEQREASGVTAKSARLAPRDGPTHPCSVGRGERAQTKADGSRNRAGKSSPSILLCRSDLVLETSLTGDEGSERHFPPTNKSQSGYREAACNITIVDMH